MFIDSNNDYQTDKRTYIIHIYSSCANESTSPVFDIGQKNIPNNSDEINVKHSVLTWNQTKIL